MRIYRVLHGKWKGDYTVYDSIEEYNNYADKDWKLIDWHNSNPDDIPLGIHDNIYVISTDGFVNKLMYKSLISKSDPIPRYIYRFPQGSFAVYRKSKTGEWRIPVFYSFLSHLHKSSLANNGTICANTRIYQHGMDKVNGFATLIVAGLSPFYAFRHIYGKTIAGGRLSLFMKSKKVRGAIMTEIEKISPNTLAKKYDAQFLVGEIDQFFNKVRKGTKTHLEGIQFITNLYKESKDPKNIKETEYKEEEELPPQ